jgi:hypothetical protein
LSTIVTAITPTPPARSSSKDPCARELVPDSDRAGNSVAS